jgi:hypothetical protein
MLTTVVSFLPMIVALGKMSVVQKAPIVGTKPMVEFIDVIDFKLSTIKATFPAENRHGFILLKLTANIIY